MADCCEGVQGNGDKRCLCNEGDLGPKNVQDGSSPAPLLQGYRRVGSLKPARFLEMWRTQVCKSALEFFSLMIADPRSITDLERRPETH